MTIGKKQIILSALVVALGAAVYINWKFVGGGQFPQSLDDKMVTSQHELGEAQLVNAQAQSSDTDTDSEDNSNSTQAPNSDDSFTELRLNRQQARDQATDLMEKTLSDSDSNEKAKQDAVNKAAEIAQTTVKESNVENLIKAKGFKDCAVFLQNDECSVIVSNDKDLKDYAMIIRDIITGQTGVSFDKIKIIQSA